MTSFFVALLSCVLSQHVVAGKEVLALLQSSDIQTSHSQFFDALQSHGFKITFKQCNEKDINFKEYDTYHYDHLIVFCPTAQGVHQASHPCSAAL